MIQTKIMFFDGCGNFHVEKITAQNMRDLEASILPMQQDLSVKWAYPDNQKTVVRWRKVDNPYQKKISLKVEIDLQQEKQFISFLNLWRVDINNKEDKEIISELPYVIRVSDMAKITLD